MDSSATPMDQVIDAPNILELRAAFTEASQVWETVKKYRNHHAKKIGAKAQLQKAKQELEDGLARSEALKDAQGNDSDAQGDGPHRTTAVSSPLSSPVRSPLSTDDEDDEDDEMIVDPAPPPHPAQDKANACIDPRLLAMPPVARSVPNGTLSGAKYTMDVDVPPPAGQSKRKRKVIVAAKAPKFASKAPKLPAKARKPKKIETPYSELNEQGQKEMNDAAEKALHRFLKKDILIPPALCNMVRRDQAFFPKAATHSRALAMSFLRTTRGNYMCLTHFENRHEKNKDTAIHLAGIPEDADIAESLQDVKDRDFNVTFSCGCATDDALFAFYIWKTTRILSPRVDLGNPIYTLGNVGQKGVPEFPSPRIRSFWQQSIKDISGAADLLDLYYSGDIPWGSQAYQEKVAKKLLFFQYQRLRDMGVKVQVLFEEA